MAHAKLSQKHPVKEDSFTTMASVKGSVIPLHNKKRKGREEKGRDGEKEMKQRKGNEREKTKYRELDKSIQSNHFREVDILTPSS